MGFKVIYENVHIFCHFSDVTTCASNGVDLVTLLVELTVLVNMILANFGHFLEVDCRSVILNVLETLLSAV